MWDEVQTLQNVWLVILKQYNLMWLIPDSMVGDVNLFFNDEDDKRSAELEIMVPGNTTKWIIHFKRIKLNQVTFCECFEFSEPNGRKDMHFFYRNLLQKKRTWYRNYSGNDEIWYVLEKEWSMFVK